jgi:hypothetical protein
VIILNCQAFDAEGISARTNNACCEDCCAHDPAGRDDLINVVPWHVEVTWDNRRVDWELGIQARVCCGRYAFVRSMSREWWVRKKAEAEGWDEEKIQSLLRPGSWSPMMEKANKARAANISVASAKAACVCGAPLRRGDSLCSKCASDDYDPNRNYGSINALLAWVKK